MGVDSGSRVLESSKPFDLVQESPRRTDRPDWLKTSTLDTTNHFFNSKDQKSADNWAEKV